MKKLLLFVLAAVAFAACEQAPIEEAQGVVMSDRSLEVSFEGADDTRIQLQNGKTVWTKGDHVSVFYRSTVNEEWQFMGETGDRTGQIVPVDNSVNPPATHNHVVVAYPYSEDYFYNTETHNVEALLPAVQNYLKDSYGTNGNIMISSSEFNKVSLKSVCGWLKLQLTGDGEVVKSITLRGNDGEQVAGLIYVDSATATATLASASGDAGDGEVGGTLVRPGTILTEVTLDCGEGVALDAEATAFYIALPPQTFEQGFTVEIEDTDGYVMEQSTAKTFVVERNTISPMAALEFVNSNQPNQPTPASNEIWYTATAKAEPYFDDFLTFGSDVVSNVWDSETKRGIITFDGDVTMIGDEAFYTCDKFTGITLPESVTSIGKKAFYDCDGLTEFIIPDSVTTIGDYAFSYCSSLTSVTIPDSVTEIGYAAFINCSSLTSVTIPDSVTTIGYVAFGNCLSLQAFNGKFASEDSRCLIIDGTLNAFAPAGLTEYTIPDSVTTIGGWAFGNCDSLTSVTIPDSVTEIGYAAFINCSSLTSVTIPNSVTTIGVRAFSYCTKLQEFKSKFAFEDGRCLIIDGTLNAFAPAGLTEYTIPNSVTSIGYAAFEDCSSLTSVTIPNSVTTIGYDAFRYCSSLTSVTIPDSVTTIGECAFYSCNSLTSVTIPDSVTTIGNYAFRYCDSLTSVTIPDSVTEIGTNAFQYCSNLTSVYCKATTPPGLGSDAFYENALGRIIYVPMESVEAYKSAEYWSDYASDIVGYNFENGAEGTPKPANNEIWYTATAKAEPYFDDFLTFGSDVVSNVWDSETKRGIITFDGDVTMIGDDAFNNCDKFTGITLPESVTSIGKKAFYDCDGLTEFIIPDSVTTIGNSAFYDCYNLTSVTIGDSVTTIGDSAFEWCRSLTSVTIGDSVTTIGDRAFCDCRSLTSVTIPNSVTTIGYDAFRYCRSLTSVTIGDSVTTIGNYAFSDCSSLTSVTIPDSVTEIGNGAFAGCTSLQEFKGKFASEDGKYLIIDGVLNFFAIGCGATEYTIPDSVTTIGDYAFWNCDSLTSVTIPDSVTTIGSSAFEACSSLTSVTIPDSVTTIGWDAFRSSSLTSVTIPDSVTTIGDYAFQYCSSLKKVYCNATIPPSLGDYVFSNNANGRRIYVYEECVELYKSAWSIYKDSIYTNGQNYPDTTTIVYITTDGNTITSSKLPIISNSYDNGVGTLVVVGKIALIPNCAFEYCSSLTSVTIPDSVTTIGKYAFHSCSSLTSVTIPDSVTSIGYQAFYGCSSLTSVYCKAVTPPTGGYHMFSRNASGRKIYVPMESVEAYKSAQVWSDYADAIVGYNF